MVQNVQEKTERFEVLVSGTPFYEGKCSSWQLGEGIFMQKLSDHSRFVFLFEADGTYKAYELGERGLTV
ncbi:hypothetical protein ACQYAD_08090 [Neobacillus sp. SM06]|uniref:hypothetical protein n=1 Tax=Neobacillus sp. SM06 TaxID=3422492 RepID=UPI003D269B2B